MCVRVWQQQQWVWSCAGRGEVCLGEYACALLCWPVQAVLRVIFGYLMAQDQQAIPSISIPLHTVIELTPRPDGTMGVEYIPVPVHLSDASMLTTSMDALPASAAAAVAAAAAVGSSGSGSSSGVARALSPVHMDLGLDPAAVAAVGACPFKQGEQQGLAAEVAAAALQSGVTPAAAADASVVIGDQGDTSSNSTGTGCGLQQDDLQHAGTAESLPCYYYVETGDHVGELPQINREEIMRMSSCSSGSSMALMQQVALKAASEAVAAAPAGCMESS